MNRRLFLQYMGAASAACCLPNAWAAEQALTLYGAPVMPTLLLAAAEKNGQAKKSRPFAVKTWKNVDVLRAGLANRSMQASMVPSYVAANLAARGQDVKLLNVMSYGLLYVVGRERALGGVADLSGKTLAMPFKNDMPDLVLQALCRSLRLDFAKIKVQYTATPPEALALFLQKRADYALMPEPMVSMAMMRGKQMGQNVVRALDIQKAWRETMKATNGIPQAGLLVSGDFYRNNGAFLRSLQADLQQAVVWSKANPQAAAAIGANYLDAPAPALAAALPHANLAAVSARQAQQDLMLFFKTLHALNPRIVGGKLPDASLFADI
ncbi:MAG: ABC transporter substrate-binding protein [Neisseria sp.]|nr:ABC transporter substrate-binding protein [Neisseria sp.]